MRNVKPATTFGSASWAEPLKLSLAFLDRTQNQRLAQVEFQAFSWRLHALVQEGLITSSAERKTWTALGEYALERALRRSSHGRTSHG